MEKPRRFHYLSVRVAVLLGAMAAMSLCLCAAYAAVLPLGAPLWPLPVMLGLLAAFAVAGYLWVVRPYHRLERMTALFMEGYTMTGGDGDVHLSRASERLLARVGEEFNSAYLLKLSKRQAQYRALQNQINPHFLYNTLESIRSEALIAGLDSVAEMTEALAVFFRYTISKVENLVSVEEELQNCATYFRIQQYRFGERLQLEIECEAEDREEIYRCRLPKLTLQPIVENSIIHGTEFKLGAGRITIRLARTKQRLLIQVSDDGIGMDEDTLARLNERLGKSGHVPRDSAAEQGGSIALINVNNRIHLIFGEEYGLNVYSMPGVGTDVQIDLPIITSDREALREEDVLA